MRQTSALHLVVPENEPTPTEEMLFRIIPALESAEKVVERLHQLMRLEMRALADERGVSFVREEQVRREFNTAKGE
jgi:hypothetical protein